MAKKELFLCDDCKFFTDKCEHESNKMVELQKRIEKQAYISLERKKNCRFYAERSTR